MNKIIMTVVAISVGLVGLNANAKDYYDIGTNLPADVLAANHCTAGSYQGGCTNPVFWSLYDGDTVESCSSWMVEMNCTACQSGYALTPYACIPDNERGTYYPNCMPDQMTPSQIADTIFIYTCRCSELFGETGVTGYLFRGCSTGSIEFKCDSGLKYYRTSTTKEPSCTVSTDSDGNFKFTRCTGCKLCNETTETYRADNTGYQRAYKNVFTNGDPATCVSTAINKWRCASGYYGTSTNGTSGCNACPSFESVGLTTVCTSDTCPYIYSTPGSNTQITDCYGSTYEPIMGVYLDDGAGKFHWVMEDDTLYGECKYQ